MTGMAAHSVVAIDEAAANEIAGLNSRLSEAERSEQRYRMLAARARDIMLFFRTDGTILEANSAALSAYGYSREELLTLSIRELRSPETWVDITAQIQRAEAGPFQFESMNRRKDGSCFPVEANWSYIDSDGERVILSVVRDITERRNHEQEVRQVTEHLALAQQVAGIGTFEWNIQTGHNYWTPQLDSAPSCCG